MVEHYLQMIKICQQFQFLTKGDDYIKDVVSKKEWHEHWEEEAPKVNDRMLRENIIDKNDLN